MFSSIVPATPNSADQSEDFSALLALLEAQYQRYHAQISDRSTTSVSIPQQDQINTIAIKVIEAAYPHFHWFFLRIAHYPVLQNLSLFLQDNPVFFALVLDLEYPLQEAVAQKNSSDLVELMQTLSTFWHHRLSSQPTEPTFPALANAISTTRKKLIEQLKALAKNREFEKIFPILQKLLALCTPQYEHLLPVHASLLHATATNSLEAIQTSVVRLGTAEEKRNASYLLNEDGLTPAAAAAKHNRLDVLQYLHAQGFDVLYAYTEEDLMPFAVAQRNQAQSVIQWFLAQYPYLRNYRATMQSQSREVVTKMVEIRGARAKLHHKTTMVGQAVALMEHHIFRLLNDALHVFLTYYLKEKNRAWQECAHVIHNHPFIHSTLTNKLSSDPYYFIHSLGLEEEFLSWVQQTITPSSQTDVRLARAILTRGQFTPQFDSIVRERFQLASRLIPKHYIIWPIQTVVPDIQPFMQGLETAIVIDGQTAVKAKWENLSGLSVEAQNMLRAIPPGYIPIKASALHILAQQGDAEALTILMKHATPELLTTLLSKYDLKSGFSPVAYAICSGNHEALATFAGRVDFTAQAISQERPADEQLVITRFLSSLTAERILIYTRGIDSLRAMSALSVAVHFKKLTHVLFLLKQSENYTRIDIFCLLYGWYEAQPNTLMELIEHLETTPYRDVLPDFHAYLASPIHKLTRPDVKHRIRHPSQKERATQTENYTTEHMLRTIAAYAARKRAEEGFQPNVPMIPENIITAMMADVDIWEKDYELIVRRLLLFKDFPLALRAIVAISERKHQEINDKFFLMLLPFLVENEPFFKWFMQQNISVPGEIMLTHTLACMGSEEQLNMLATYFGSDTRWITQENDAHETPVALAFKYRNHQAQRFFIKNAFNECFQPNSQQVAAIDFTRDFTALTELSPATRTFFLQIYAAARPDAAAVTADPQRAPVQSTEDTHTPLLRDDNEIQKALKAIIQRWQKTTLFGCFSISNEEKTLFQTALLLAFNNARESENTGIFPLHFSRVGNTAGHWVLALVAVDPEDKKAIRVHYHDASTDADAPQRYAAFKECCQNTFPKNIQIKYQFETFTTKATNCGDALAESSVTLLKQLAELRKKQRAQPQARPIETDTHVSTDTKHLPQASASPTVDGEIKSTAAATSSLWRKKKAQVTTAPAETENTEARANTEPKPVAAPTVDNATSIQPVEAEATQPLNTAIILKLTDRNFNAKKLQDNIEHWINDAHALIESALKRGATKLAVCLCQLAAKKNNPKDLLGFAYALAFTGEQKSALWLAYIAQNIHSNSNNTLCHYAAEIGATEFFLALDRKHKADAKKLTASTKKRHAKPSDDELLEALEKANSALPAHLLAKNKGGNTPLHIAFKHEQEQIILFYIDADYKTLFKENNVDQTPVEMVNEEKADHFLIQMFTCLTPEKLIRIFKELKEEEAREERRLEQNIDTSTDSTRDLVLPSVENALINIADTVSEGKKPLIAKTLLETRSCAAVHFIQKNIRATETRLTLYKQLAADKKYPTDQKLAFLCFLWRENIIDSSHEFVRSLNKQEREEYDRVLKVYEEELTGILTKNDGDAFIQWLQENPWCLNPQKTKGVLLLHVIMLAGASVILERCKDNPQFADWACTMPSVGDNAFHILASQHQMPFETMSVIFNLLLAKNVSPFAQNTYGMSPEQAAKAANNESFLQLLDAHRQTDRRSVTPSAAFTTLYAPATDTGRRPKTPLPPSLPPVVRSSLN